MAMTEEALGGLSGTVQRTAVRALSRTRPNLGRAHPREQRPRAADTRCTSAAPRWSTLTGLGPVLDGMALNNGIGSYGDRVIFCFTADRDALARSGVLRGVHRRRDRRTGRRGKALDHEGTIMTRAPLNGSGFTAVIGGGGAMAIGISAGILIALKEAGLDVADATAAIGTSAGSTVAADVQLGVPLDEIAARVCTDRSDDALGDVAGDRDDDPAPLATTRAWRSWPELGRRAVGSTWVLTRAMSPVRVPLPEPPGFLRRNFPGALLSLGESHDWASEFYPEAWPDRRICAVASDLDSGRRVMLEADPADGDATRHVAPSTAGVVCDPWALPAGARRRRPPRRRRAPVGHQPRPRRPPALASRAGHQRDHVRPVRSAERPGPPVADVAEPHRAPRGGVPAASRPRGACCSVPDASRSNSPARRCSPDASRATSSRPRTRAPGNGWRCPTCKAISNASRSPRRPVRPPDSLG